MPIIIQNSKTKLMCENGKIAKMYCQGDVIYSSGNIVTYVVQGVNYSQEYDEGESVLSPSVVTPVLSGASFLGWSTSKSSTSVVSNLVMGDGPITLYAVFKYNDSSTYTTGETSVQVKQHQGTNPNQKALGGAPTIDTNIYGSLTFISGSNCTISIDKNEGYGSRTVSVSLRVGNNSVSLGSRSYNDSLGQSDWGGVDNYKNKTYSLNLSKNGNQTIYLYASLSGGNGYCVGSTYMNSGKLTLHGRTVVG